MTGWDTETPRSFALCGPEVFVGHHTVFTNPSKVHLKGRVRIDPFTLVTTGLTARENIQICSHAVLGGGGQHTIRLGNWTFIGYGSQLFCASEDYGGSFGPVNEWWGGNRIFRGDIMFSDYSGVASQVIVMPGVTLPEGCLIGAQSFVYKSDGLEPWSVYLGNPLRLLKRRDKQAVLDAVDNPSFLKRRS